MDTDAAIAAITELAAARIAHAEDKANAAAAKTTEAASLARLNAAQAAVDLAEAAMKAAETDADSTWGVQPAPVFVPVQRPADPAPEPVAADPVVIADPAPVDEPTAVADPAPADPTVTE